MTENAADTEKTTGSTLIEEPAAEALPTEMSLAEDSAAAPPPQAVPVPTEDVVKCAKPKCATCFGKGKLVYHAPGETKARTKVCACAIRQFVRQHRRELLIDKAGRFYYIPLPEGSDEREPESTSSASPETLSGLSEYNQDRIRIMFARIAGHQAELVKLEARYDDLAEPIKVELQVAEAERAGDAAKLQEIAEEDRRLQAEVAAINLKIEDLAAQLLEAKRGKLELEGCAAELNKRIAAVEDASLPGLRKRAGIEQRLADVERKRGQAKRPMQQKIDSLRKRIDHLAAVYSVPAEILAELAKPRVDDDGDDVAEQAADDIVAEVVQASE